MSFCKRRKWNRLPVFTLISATALAAASGTKLQAATYTWISTSHSSWSNSANWSGGTPISSAATLLSLGGGEAITCWTADPALSLAWKLNWLLTDIRPQSKDLYDATLLAETTPLSLNLLYEVMTLMDVDKTSPEPLSPEFPMRLDVDWENFREEYPWIYGEADDWKARLAVALAPMFAQQ